MSYNRFGRVNYSTISTPETDHNWIYSYQELQDDLNNICKNHTLKKAYVSLQGYLESCNKSENYYDFSYSGGSVILILDNIAVEICIHAVGMVEYRRINLCDIKIKTTKDFPPSGMGLKGDNYFYDLGNQFQLTYEGQKVLSVIVDKTNCYAFYIEGFDEKKANIAEENECLPANIHFKLENGVDFGIYADWLEWFCIKLEK